MLHKLLGRSVYAVYMLVQQLLHGVESATHRYDQLSASLQLAERRSNIGKGSVKKLGRSMNTSHMHTQPIPCLLTSCLQV